MIQTAAEAGQSRVVKRELNMDQRAWQLALDSDNIFFR
jgi:hypothetical protein